MITKFSRWYWATDNNRWSREMAQNCVEKLWHNGWKSPDLLFFSIRIQKWKNLKSLSGCCIHSAFLNILCLRSLALKIKCQTEIGITMWILRCWSKNIGDHFSLPLSTDLFSSHRRRFLNKISETGLKGKWSCRANTIRKKHLQRMHKKLQVIFICVKVFTHGTHCNFFHFWNETTLLICSQKS